MYRPSMVESIGSSTSNSTDGEGCMMRPVLLAESMGNTKVVVEEGEEETVGTAGRQRRPWWHLVSIQHQHQQQPHLATLVNSSTAGANLIHPRTHSSSSSSFSSSSSSTNLPISYASKPVPHPQIPPPPAPIPSLPCTSIKLLPLLVSFQRRRRRGLSFHPSNKLYFPYEPGKQSTSAVRIMNVSRSAMAFKFQTTSPKSCFMRPPNGVLAPAESIVASVVKFIELPKAPEQAPLVVQKRCTRDKFKIVSLKMKEGVEFTPDLFEVHKELVAVEQILQVVLLNPNHHCNESVQLKLLLAEANAAQEARKKLEAQTSSSVSNISDINILEEWRQRKLAREKINK